jgi:hypothetical protein
VKPRRRVADTGVVAAPGGGGDIRGMQKAGGFGSYSAVGFRAVPPIERGPAPAEPSPEPAEPVRELAAAGVVEPQ